MKPVLMIAVVFGAVLAGGAGGYVASQLAPTETPKATPVVAQASNTDELEETIATQDKTIGAMNGRIAELNRRLDNAEASNRQIETLTAKLASMEAQVAKTAERPAAADGTVPAAPPALEGGMTLDEAVERVLAQREERQRQEREAERERQMTEMVARGNQQMVDRLTQSLTLTNDQQVKVKALIEDYSAKRREIWTRGNEARRNGQEFDWNAELLRVSAASTDAVRNELSSAQLSTFNELVGDRGLAALEQRRGVGTEGFGGAAPGTPGGNREGGRQPGGRRGGNNN